MSTAYHTFLQKISAIANSRQSNSIVLEGAGVHDLFKTGQNDSANYDDLLTLIKSTWSDDSIFIVTYTLNKGISFARKEDKEKFLKYLLSLE